MLKLENRIKHNVNNIEFDRYIVQNYMEEQFDDDSCRGGSGFGCACDKDRTERECMDENVRRLTLRWIDNPLSPRERDIDKWFFELFEGFDPETIDADECRIDIYYCAKCKQWAVDTRY